MFHLSSESEGLKMPRIKLFISLTVISVVIVAGILISTYFCWLSFSNGDADKDEGPSCSTFLKQNVSKDVIRARQAELMLSFINESVNPCEDFYEYACGNWERHNKIPNDRWQYSTVQTLHEIVENELKDILSQPVSANEGAPSAMDKTKIFYKNCMDEETQNKRGVEPLLKYINELGGWPVLDDNWSEKKFDWLQMVINTSFIDGKGLILSMNIEKNPTVATENILFLDQTTLGMFNRDNYLKEENSKTLEAYRQLIENVLILLEVNVQKARNVSQQIVNFEKLLANATLPPEQIKTQPYFQPTVEVLIETYSYIDWKRYLSGVLNTDISNNRTVLIQLSAQYYINLYYVLTRTENVVLANYMIWRCVLFLLVSMGDTFRGAWNEFNMAATGQVEPIPIWKICVNQVNNNMGMATSGMYVRKNFDESSKKSTIKIIETLKEVFDENLSELDWIDKTTKAYASKKANAMRIAAGYPNYICSEDTLNHRYEDIEIVEGKHFENSLKLIKRNQKKSLARLFKPFDRNEWMLAPTNVNALYVTGANQILILAGLLQPPIFNQYFPQCLNFGAIGMFMGHEVIHGFDDMGRKFDVNGDPLKWWSTEAIEHFEKKKNCFLQQYEKYAEKDNAFTSIGTLSENLADNGGLRLAYKGYSKWKSENQKSIVNETLPNMKYNENQLFFLSFAQLFCTAVRPEALVESRSYEAHSPGKYRVLGALTNFEEFSEAYGCPLDSPMNPSHKCRLW